jgi:hypothetical protein
MFPVKTRMFCFSLTAGGSREGGPGLMLSSRRTRNTAALRPSDTLSQTPEDDAGASRLTFISMALPLVALRAAALPERRVGRLTGD